jgi:hypothetical protein
MNYYIAMAIPVGGTILAVSPLVIWDWLNEHKRRR